MRNKAYLIFILLFLSSNTYAQLKKKWALTGIANFNFEKQVTTNVQKIKFNDFNNYIESKISFGYFLNENFLVGINLGGFYHHQNISYFQYNYEQYGIITGVELKYFFKLNNKSYLNLAFNPYYAYTSKNDINLNNINIYYNNLYINNSIAYNYLFSKNIIIFFGLNHSTQFTNQLNYSLGSIFLIN